MVILSVVLVGAHSAIMIAAKAVPAPDDRVAINAAATKALSAIADEIGVGTSFTVRDATGVAFTVPDRTGDGLDDTLRYAWSGKPGDPLTFAINGAAPTTLVPEVQTFALAYETAAKALPTTYSESAETQLYSYSTSTAGTGRPVGKFGGNVYLRAQYFRPTLPAGAVSWSVTGVTFWGRRQPNWDVKVQLQVRTQRAGDPTDRQLSADGIAEATLGTAWTRYDVRDINVKGLLPTEYVCIVFAPIAGNDYIDVLFERNAATADSYGLSSTDAGVTWTRATDTLVCVVNGRVVRADPAATTTVLTGVRYTLRAGSDSSPQYTGTWPVNSRPEVKP